MPCTTLLVGKKASYDGSTIIARNEDSPGGVFTPKKLQVIHPADQPRHYRSVLSHVEIDLPEKAMRYTSVPDAIPKDGIWAEAGVNEKNVAMSATETLTTNERVLGADPLVELQPAKGKPGEEGYVAEVPGGIGEEDMVTLVLPYISSAREGVLLLGSYLEKYGTYEMNGAQPARHRRLRPRRRPRRGPRLPLLGRPRRVDGRQPPRPHPRLPR